MLECLEGEPNAIKKTKLASFLFERIKVLEPIDRTVFGYFYKLGHLMKNGGVDDKKIAHDCFVQVLDDQDGPQEQMNKEISILKTEIEPDDTWG